MKEAEEIVNKATKAETLDEHDVSYHAHLAKRRIEETPRLHAQIEQLSKQLNDLEGAHVVWAGYLRDKYGFKEGDRVEADGTIHRGEQAA